MNENKLFNKADSLIAIRHRQVNQQRIIERIREVRNRVRAGGGDRARIVLQACDDLLGEGTGCEGTRFSLREHVAEEIQCISDEELPRYLFYRYRYDIYPQINASTGSLPACRSNRRRAAIIDVCFVTRPTRVSHRPRTDRWERWTWSFSNASSIKRKEPAKECFPQVVNSDRVVTMPDRANMPGGKK